MHEHEMFEQLANDTYEPEAVNVALEYDYTTVNFMS